MVFEINYLAVLVASAANMAVGYVWYGPLFGKVWMKLVGKTEKDLKSQSGKMPLLYGTMFAATLIFNYVLAHFVRVGNATDILSGAGIGFWAWLGFIATTSLGEFIFSAKPKNLYALQNGHHVVNFLLSGAILATWR